MRPNANAKRTMYSVETRAMKPKQLFDSVCTEKIIKHKNKNKP